MGSSSTKPEFITVLADKQVKRGDTITLSCKANTELVIVTWTKNDMKLCCVKDKHIILKNATKFSLEIVNAQEADGGKYTINLKNRKGEISCSSYVRVEIKEWRNFDSNQKQLLNNLKEFKIFHKIPKLHFLLYGPVGGGKSSTINTIRTIFEGRQLVECLAAALSETSHTKCFDSFEISEKHGSFPFTFYDTMGVQAQDGVHINDIIAALKGHMKVGYMCEPKTPLSEDSIYYLKYPSLSDRMHCLLCIIPADKIGLMGKDFLDQFKMVCKATQDIKVPQVVLMTRVECVCVMTRNNLRNVYKSQKIRDKINECSNKLGVPVNRIFPVKNYHEETDVNEDINCLMLDALNNIIHRTSPPSTQLGAKESEERAVRSTELHIEDIIQRKTQCFLQLQHDTIMGLFSSKPEFVTVLSDIYTTECGEKTLQCEANTKDVTATWEKDDSKFMCVEGEHRVRKEGKKCILEIFKAKETDEGKYTLNLSKSSSSVSCSTLVKIVIPQWRDVQWKRQDEMLNNLKTFKVCNPVEQLNFLLYGLVGAGKSSTINTIRSIFEGRLYVNCLAAAGSTTSHTLSFGSYNFKNEEGSFPFAFYDVMGAEADAKAGVNTQDIISALKGHMKEGYKFSFNAPVSESDHYYKRNPSLGDQMHCLVNVIAADKMTDNEFLKKWKTIRETVSSMGIPQVLFITHVDRGCPLIKDNLQNVYKSRKIKEKMIQCSNLTGIPMNLIFPVVNYHEQTNMNTDINCLMLDALKIIVHWANDYVKKRSDNQTSHQE